MLPRSVQDQANAAKALQDQLNQPATEEIENPAPAAAPEPEPQPTPAEPAAQPAPEPQPETRDATYWRHRFDVLQGKYNAEVPALRKEIATLKDQLSAADKQQPASAVQRAQEAMSDLTEAEIEEYGPDLVNLIKRVAGSAAAPGNNGDLQEIKSELGQLREEKRQDAEARFWTDLETQVPKFRAVNADPAFHQWLAEIDPLSGQPRQQLLVGAQQALDAYRVAAVFKSFAAVAPKASQEPIPGELVQPRQARSAAPEPQQGKVWSRAEISEFYRNKASYPKDQAAAIETDIFAAQAQGRIR